MLVMEETVEIRVLNRQGKSIRGNHAEAQSIAQHGRHLHGGEVPR